MKRFTWLILLGLYLLSPTLRAQSTSATISGGVTDPAGNFITDAAVEIANDATGVIYSARTNSSGLYILPILPPGNYHVQVSKQGFRTIIKPDIVLNVQGAVALNFVLPVGARSESVTVESGISLLNTTDASVSTVIDRKFVENMPLNGRSFQDLISMTPGVVTQSPQSGSAIGYNGDFSVNGQRTESNYYTVDGVSGNVSAGAPLNAAQAANSGSVPSSTVLGTTQSLVSVDALQEFRVQSSSYSAEYGRSPGGQFSLATRSGTNAIHGTAYDYLRNNYFDANDWFNNYYHQPIAALRQNDFGGTVGGPIVIPHLYRGFNRSFFFASYEGLRLVQPQAASVQYVPDTFMRQQAPVALRGIMNAFPRQNGRDYGTAASPSLAEFIQSFSLPGTIDSTSVRIDHTINPKLALFFRFSDTPSSTSTRTLSSLITNKMSTQTYTFGITSQLSNELSNEFRLGHARSESSQKGTLDSFGGAVPTDVIGAMGLGSYAHPYPYIGLIFTGIGGSYITLNDAQLQNRQWNIVDTATWSAKRHQFKLGMDYRRILAPSARATPFASAYFYGTTGVLNNTTTILSASKYNPFTSVFNETAAFAQDDWRITNRLSLSAGVRWEINPPPTEADGNAPYTVLGDISNPSSLVLAPRGTPLWKTSWFNFAPRLGIAWRANDSQGHETVLRFGGGVFFDTDNVIATGGFASVGFAASKSFAGSPLPLTPAQLNFSPSANPPYTSTTVYAFPSHLQLPYTLQWNVSLQQALGKAQTFTVSYVGSDGRRLLQRQLVYVTATNPLFGYIAYYPSGIKSNFQSLQVQYQRSLEHGLQALASYTWSHSIDFGSSYSSLPLLRGNSDFDVRNNFSAGISWEIPGPKTSKALHWLAADWGSDARLMARGAFPIFLYGNYLTDPSTGSLYYANVNYNVNRPIYLYGPQYPGGRALNGGTTATSPAFTLPSGSDPGNAPRNFVRGFGAWQVNLAIRREIRPAEKLRIQFRAETFNLLNHPNFGYVQPFLTNATFGKATAMLNQSLSTVASQYQQGGPRSMQFALKLIF